MPRSIASFQFAPGHRIGQRYVIESRLGGGSEGEVYQIRERSTGIRRAAKFYFPHRDPTRKLAVKHARKLNILRHCPIVMQYHHSELVEVDGREIVVLISELCDGQPLEQWLRDQRAGRLSPYMAMHVLFNLVRGLEAIHALGEYHADVHSQNILIRPTGVRFDLKLIDFFDWGRPSRGKQRQDIRDAVAVFHECLGGAKAYARQPDEVKYIIAGLRRDLMLKRFPTMNALRRHLETFDWQLLA